MIIGFDLDGTLVDSFSEHWLAVVESCKSIGINLTDQHKSLFYGRREEESLKILNPKLTNKEIMNCVRVKEEIYKKRTINVLPFPDTVKTLYELRKKATLVLMSNCNHEEIINTLQVTNINPLLFDKIIGADEVEHPKPAPDEIFLAKKLEKHDIDYFVGDTVVDIHTGKSAGVKAIAVATGATPKEDLEKAEPFKVIDHLHQLTNIIK